MGFVLKQDIVPNKLFSLADELYKQGENVSMYGDDKTAMTIYDIADELYTMGVDIKRKHVEL
jgi:hypothetical protein